MKKRRKIIVKKVKRKEELGEEKVKMNKKRKRLEELKED